MTTTIDTLIPEQLWQAIQPLRPTSPRRYHGRSRVDDVRLAGIVYQLRTGIPSGSFVLSQPGRDSPSPAGGGCATGNAPVNSAPTASRRPVRAPGR
jgi:hypothetical protein